MHLNLASVKETENKNNFLSFNQKEDGSGVWVMIKGSESMATINLTWKQYKELIHNLDDALISTVT
jgi:hypothetical protein